MFDGWSGGDTHYTAVFAAYPADNECGFKKFLLAISPMGDEDSLDASQHYEYVKYVLEVHGKKFENVVAIVGDNTATNKSFARRVGPFFQGCYSHRYNLAMKDIISSYSFVIDKVHELMKKLKYQIPAAKLRSLTHLTAQTANETRWSSTYHMIRRYDEIRDHLPALNLPEINELLLDEDDELMVATLLKKLRGLDSGTKQLQSENVTIAEARGLFDAVMEKHPSTSSRLRPDADIVSDTAFESAIIKIQGGNENKLRVSEKKAVSHLLKQRSAEETGSSTATLSFAEQVLKRMRTEKISESSKYIDLRFVLAT